MTETRLWYPHYIDDFNRKTRDLSLAVRGAYRALMDAYWERQGPLPADDDRIIRMIGAKPEEWSAVRNDVLAFFDERDGLLHQSRIDREIEKARKQYEAKAGRMASARAKRWKGKPSLDQEDDLPSDQASEQKSDQLAHQISGTPIPLPAPGSKEPHNVRLGEEFWKNYPHPPNRGSKTRVVNAINALSEAEQRAAVVSLPAHRRAIAATRKRHKDFQPCMAETFINGRRWEAFDSDAGEEEGPRTIDVQWPEDEKARAKAEALQKRVGKGPYASYFGGSPPRLEGDLWRVIPPTPAVADLMENRFALALDDVYGRGKWRMGR